MSRPSNSFIFILLCMTLVLVSVYHTYQGNSMTSANTHQSKPIYLERQHLHNARAGKISRDKDDNIIYNTKSAFSRHKISPEMGTTISLKSNNVPDNFTGKIWVSMAICWSENTVLHNKENYPYSYALELSVKLWHLRTNHSTILYIIYKRDKEKREEKLNEYIAKLEKIGAQVYLVESIPEMTCPTQSQTERLLAFRSSLIGDDDIIVTSDADAFVKDTNIFQPLTLSKYRYWVFQYNYSLKTGSSFPLCFIAMKSRDWKKLLNVNTTTAMKQKYSHLYKEKGYNWYFDQTLITYLLLKNHYCTVPKKHNLWNDLGLNVPVSDISDPLCYHGNHYANCYKYRPRVNVPGGCKYWHFMPSEREKDMKKRFDLIMAGKH